MSFGIKVRVWGEQGCFTRAEMKAERMSYDVITPSAARNILQCLYWKPSINWVIDRITVLSPIDFGSIMLNEVKQKAKMPKKDLSKMSDDDYFMYTAIGDNRAQRRITYLKNPHYIIEAHFEPSGIGEDTNDHKKHYNIIMRRLRNGQVFKQPCMGLSNFPAHVCLVEEGEVFTSPIAGVRDLGFMLYDHVYKLRKAEEEVDAKSCEEQWESVKSRMTNTTSPIFYRPIMRDGVIDVAECYKNSAKGGDE